MTFMLSKAILFLIIVTGLLLVPNCSEAATLYVDGISGSDSPTCGDESFPCLSVEVAISNAAAGDTILIAPGNYTFPLNLTKPLSIQGDDSDIVVLQCAPNEQILLNSTEGTFSIKGISFSECQVDVASSRIYMETLTFQDHAALGLLDGTNASLVDCTFQGVELGLFVDGSQAVMHNCSFSQIDGGGVFAQNSFLSVQGCAFHDNRGGASIFASNSFTAIDFSYFRDNIHTIGTVVMLLVGEPGVISNSRFEHTSQLFVYYSLNYLLLQNCTFIGSSQSQDPLVLVTRSANLLFESCSFEVPSDTVVPSLAIRFAVYLFSSENVAMQDCFCETSGRGCIHGERTLITVNKHRGHNRLQTSSIRGISVPLQRTAFFPFAVLGNSEAPSWSTRTGSAFIRVAQTGGSPNVLVLANLHSISFSIPDDGSDDGFNRLNVVITSSTDMGALTITSLAHPVLYQNNDGSWSCIVVAGVSSVRGSGITLIRSTLDNPTTLNIQSVLYWIVPDVSSFGVVIDAAFDQSANRFSIVTSGTDHIVLISVDADYSLDTFLGLLPHGFAVSSIRFFNGTSFLTAGCVQGFLNVAAFSIVDSTFTLHFRARLVPNQTESDSFTCTPDTEPLSIDVHVSEGAAPTVDAVVTDPFKQVFYAVRDVFGSVESCPSEKDNNTILCLRSQERQTSSHFKQRAFGKSVAFLDSGPTSDERFVVTFTDAVAFFANLSADLPYLKIPNRFVTDYSLQDVVVAPVPNAGLMVYTPELATQGNMTPFLFPFTNTPGEMLDIIPQAGRPPVVKRIGCTPGTFSNTSKDFSFCHACPMGTFQTFNNASYCFLCPNENECPTGTVSPVGAPQRLRAPKCFRESSDVVTFDSFIISAMFYPLSLSFYLGTLFVITIILPPLIFLLVIHCPCFSGLKILVKFRGLLLNVLQKVNFIGTSKEIPKVVDDIRSKVLRKRTSPEKPPRTTTEDGDSEEKPADYVGSFLSLLFIVYVLVFLVYTLIFLFSCYCPDGDCEHPYLCFLFEQPKFNKTFPFMHFSVDSLCSNTHNTLSLRPSEQFNSLITQLSKMPLHIEVRLDGVPFDQCNVESVSIDPCSTPGKECSNIPARKVAGSTNWCLISVEIDPLMSYGDFVVSILFDSEIWLPSRINSTLQVNGSQFGTYQDDAADHNNDEALKYTFAQYPLYDLVYPTSNYYVLYGPISRSIQRTFIVHEKSAVLPFQSGQRTAGALLNSITASEFPSKVHPGEFEFDENMQLELTFRIETTTHIEFRTTTPFVSATGVITTLFVAFLAIIKLFQAVHGGVAQASKIGSAALEKAPTIVNKVLKRGDNGSAPTVELETVSSSRSPPVRGRSLLD